MILYSFITPIKAVVLKMKNFGFKFLLWIYSQSNVVPDVTGKIFHFRNHLPGEFSFYLFYKLLSIISTRKPIMKGNSFLVSENIFKHNTFKKKEMKLVHLVWVQCSTENLYWFPRRVNYGVANSSAIPSSWIQNLSALFKA